MQLVEISEVVLGGTPLGGVPLATVEVRLRSDDSLASIYSDADGATPLANPLTTDALGRFVAYAEPGSYNLVITPPAGSASTTRVELAFGGTVDRYDVIPRYGVVADGTTDDTAALQAAIDAKAGGEVFLTPGEYAVTTLEVPANTVVKATPGTVTIQRLATATPGDPLVKLLGSNTKLIGLTLRGIRDLGSADESHGIEATSATTDIEIRDCLIEWHTTHGIELPGVTGYLIQGNRIENNGSAAVDLVQSSSGRVIGNSVYYNGHGIQWWGGDAAVPDPIAIFDITIQGNYIDGNTSQETGIWGSCGSRISVVGNVIKNVIDVGIDFEGCTHCTAQGNTIVNAPNGGITLFYSSSRITITGNSIQQTSGIASGIHVLSGTCSEIVISGNSCLSGSGFGVHVEQDTLIDSAITGNVMRSTGGRAIVISGCSRLLISDNRMICSGATGITMFGTSKSMVCGNVIRSVSDSTVAAGSLGGIHLFWGSSSSNAQENTVKHNRIEGFFASITDDCWGDLTSHNLIEGNRVDSDIYRRVGAGYAGLITGNRDAGNPNTAVAETTF